MVGRTLEPTQEELGDLSLAAQRLWDLDERLTPGQDYRINLQRGKKSYNTADTAGEPFFSYVNEQALRRGTFPQFRALLDNYNKATGVAEKLTPQQEGEVTAFLDALLASRPMQYTHRYLVAKSLVAADPYEFKKQLYQMWFRLYTRETRDDTCGFEHVFVGEIERGEVKGLHNWVRFYEEERAGNLNYTGFLLPRGRNQGEQAEQDETEQLLSLQFTWFGKLKETGIYLQQQDMNLSATGQVTSFFIGSTPEFELALYTLCFVAGREETIVSLGDYEVKIRAYQIRSKYGAKVGSCFPELVSKVPGRHIPQAPSPQGAYAPPGPHQHTDPSSNPHQQPAWFQQPAPAWQQNNGYPQQQQQHFQQGPGGYGQPQGGQYAPPPGTQQGQQQGCGDVLKALLDLAMSFFKKK